MARGAALRSRLGLLLLGLACTSAAAGPKPPPPPPPSLRSDPPPKAKGPPQRSDKADATAPATESGLLKAGDGPSRAPAGERPAPGAQGPSPGAPGAAQREQRSGVSASGPVPSAAGAFAGSAATLANMPASAGGSSIAIVPGLATAASKKTSSSKADNNNSSGGSSSSSSAKGGGPSPPDPAPGASPKPPSPDTYSSPKVQVVVIRQGERDAGLPGSGSDGNGSAFANPDDLLVVSLFPSISNIAGKRSPVARIRPRIQRCMGCYKSAF